MSTLVSGMCSICCHMALVFAVMHLYSMFNLRLFLSILLKQFFLIWYWNARSESCIFSASPSPVKFKLWMIVNISTTDSCSKLTPSFCLPGSFNFIFLQFLQSSTVEWVSSSEWEFILVVGIHFVSPWYDPQPFAFNYISLLYLSTA